MGHAREDAYRPALKQLMEAAEDTVAVNDPKHSEFGAPDFIFLRRSNPNIIKGYAEAKDVGTVLDGVESSDQMQRYAGYANLFLTDYLEFRFLHNGEKYQTISIGNVNKGVLHLNPDEGDRLWRELNAFLTLPPEEIKSGKRLAEIMGAKARRIRDNVAAFLGDGSPGSGELVKIYTLMRQMLVHDLTAAKFSDMYAQTLVYGLFVARYNDATAENFTRAEARDLVPRSNPFLRQFFDHIAGVNFDPRLAKIVDELCQVFSVSNVQDIVHRHLRIQDEVSEEQDPIIHFYEDFLKAYDAKQRKLMGAYYTPVPVVKFIVRAVDRILKQEFGVTQGLSSTETVSYKIDIGQDTARDRRRKRDTTVTRTEPRVQILDPAVGTATFLNEVIKHIHKGFAGQEGRWPAYVRDNLVPRLYGFELMMAPYTIAHLKLGMTLQETGAGELPDRLNVFLTNTLEAGVPTQPDLFTFGLAEAVSEESRGAAEVKQEKPVMVVLGNPPYSGISSNETDYANSLIAKYKVEPGGFAKLQERKHWLNDDYVKFVAFAEAMIAKNQSGVMGMITNNGYLDNPTFRGMRWQLARTFDTIYVLDLHGNAKKGDHVPGGGKDENVFDIMQGVGIILAVKTGRKTGELASVFHADLYGLRKEKFEALNEDRVVWTEIPIEPRSYYFSPKDLSRGVDYAEGVSLKDLFMVGGTGVLTMGDGFVVAEDADVLRGRLASLREPDITAAILKSKYGLGKNYPDFALSFKDDLVFTEHRLVKYYYRPLDIRWTYYDNKVLWRWRDKVMKHFFHHSNVGLTFCRQLVSDEFSHAFLVDGMPDDSFLSSKTRERGYVAPLWLYHDDGSRTPNFDAEELMRLTANLCEAPDPEDVLDYVYAILYSPSYREDFRALLKLDFPRIPVIPSDERFAELVPLGRQLRELHLMTSEDLETPGITYPQVGSDVVAEVSYRSGDVYINNEQYFGGVPQVAWDFWVGGHQPAQKWLKDRQGSRLSDRDLWHYQRLVKALTETHRIMDEIG